jgi:hypothetical protein
MNRTTGDPVQPGGPPVQRPACSPCLPVRNVMRILPAGGHEKISVTTENSGQAVKAVSDFLRTLAVIPGPEEP